MYHWCIKHQWCIIGVSNTNGVSLVYQTPMIRSMRLWIFYASQPKNSIYLLVCIFMLTMPGVLNNYLAWLLDLRWLGFNLIWRIILWLWGRHFYWMKQRIIINYYLSNKFELLVVDYTIIIRLIDGQFERLIRE